MDILTNTWFVGIATGLISSLIVYVVTSKVFSGAAKKEYAAHIGAANREVILALRPSIPEGAVPTVDVVKALIAATARRHDLNPWDLYGPEQLSQDLIKEVMDSSFIAAQTKKDYCEKLLTLKAPDGPPRETKRPKDQFGNALAAITALMMGVTTGLLTALPLKGADDTGLRRAVIVLGVVLLAAILGAVALWLRTRRARQRETMILSEMVAKIRKNNDNLSKIVNGAAANLSSNPPEA